MAHAKGAVDKDLQLDGTGLADGCNLAAAELPGENHPADAHFRGLQNALKIVDRHLGAGVDGHIRRHLADHLQHAQILYQNGVHACVLRVQHNLCGGLQFPVQDQRIEGQIDLHAADVTVADGLAELLGCKVFGVHAGVEGAVAQIDRVCAVLHRGHQRVAGAGGG